MLKRNPAIVQVYKSYPTCLSELFNNRQAYGLEPRPIKESNYDSKDATGVPIERTRAVYRDYSVAASVLGGLRTKVDSALQEAERQRILAEEKKKQKEVDSTE